jgi:Ca-activated chloride channel homolog
VIEFLRPGWLLLTPAVALVYLVWKYRHQLSPWRGVVDPQLLPHLLVDSGGPRATWPWMVLALGYLVAIVALAGPALLLPESGAMTRVQARVIVLDLSPSMDSTDVQPSRLVRAQFKIRDVLEQSRDVQHGLVVFSGDAFTVSPVTADSATLLNLLDAVSTDIMPVTGNRLDRAVTLALELLAGAHHAGGEILLVTDGVDGFDSNVAESILDAGATLGILAVGTRDGAPITAADGSLVKDADGNILVSSVDLVALAELARAAHGLMISMTADNADLDHLIAATSSIANARAVEREETVTRRRDVGPWLVLLLLPAAALLFRRGCLLGIVALLAVPVDSYALSWSDLWTRPDQQAARDVQAQRFDSAIERGATPWRGPALYRSGDYAGAVEEFSSATDADAYYNLGNALARSGELQQAMDAYQSALERQPHMEDAQHNLELVRQLLEQQSGESSEQLPSPESGDDSNGDSGSDSQPDSEHAAQDSSTTSGDDTGEGNEPVSSSASEPGELTSDPQQMDDGSESAQDDETAQSSSTEASESMSDTEREGQEDLARESPPLDRDTAESRQAVDQWLRRIPDDPRGLLRRKFQYQYQQRRGTGG